MKLKIRAILSIITFAVAISDAAITRNSDYSSNIKAAFIYNFTKYMNWVSQDSTTFTIAIIGDSEITTLLQEIAQKRQVEHKQIQIKHIKNTDRDFDCHILFISATEKLHLGNIIEKTHGKNILTISEVDNALSNGVMINFINIDETIKFEINLQAMKKAQFKPSSQLLKVAARVVE